MPRTVSALVAAVLCAAFAPDPSRPAQTPTFRSSVDLIAVDVQVLDLMETSAYYLLGVEPATADRDGRLRELKVAVREPGVTVRHRTWVIVPKR